MLDVYYFVGATINLRRHLSGAVSIEVAELICRRGESFRLAKFMSRHSLKKSDNSRVTTKSQSSLSFIHVETAILIRQHTPLATKRTPPNFFRLIESSKNPPGTFWGVTSGTTISGLNKASHRFASCCSATSICYLLRPIVNS
jgi:hypothetical protein